MGHLHLHVGDADAACVLMISVCVEGLYLFNRKEGQRDSTQSACRNLQILTIAQGNE